MAAGVLRHPMHGVCNQSGDTDFQLSGPRDLKHRMDEVARMTRWHRIAPPMGLGTLWPALPTHVDATKLQDSWTFRPGDTCAPVCQLVGLCQLLPTYSLLPRPSPCCYHCIGAKHVTECPSHAGGTTR
jgi:hypothetical protein|eukprot:COSAG01_NODE_3367_length_6187_cov_26.119087_5_plen_128_part_00